MRKWSQETIAREILRRHDAGEDLSYSAMTRSDLPLLRAAARYFGTWQNAIEYAGLNYDEIRKYRHWTNERMRSTIRSAVSAAPSTR